MSSTTWSNITRWFSAAALAVASMAPAAAFANKVNQLSKVDTSETDGVTSIIVRGTSTPIFTVYKLDDPERVVVDLSNARLSDNLVGKDGKAVWRPNTWAVGSVAGYQQDGRGSKARLVVTLARSATYRVRAVGNDIEMRVTPRQSKPKGNLSAAEQRQLEEQRQAIARERREAEAQKVRANKTSAAARQERERAAELLREAKEMQARAKREVEAARVEARATKEAAASTAARAASDRAAADRRLAEAKSMMKEAEARMEQARTAESKAQKVAEVAEKRQASASAAENRARAAEAVARKAEQAAKQSRARASQAKGANESAALERRATELAAIAKKERENAEQALAVANKARREAAKATKQARLERERAVAERTRANNEQRAAGEKQRDAEKARATAENRRTAAEAEARLAERKASELRASLREIVAQVEKAKALRIKEERALARAAAARDGADRSKVAAAEAEYKSIQAKTAAARRELEKAEAARLEVEKKAEAARAAYEKKAKALAVDAKRPRIHTVEFVNDSGFNRVVLGLSSPVAPKVSMNRNKRAVLVISDVAVNKSLEKTIDTSKFGGPVRAVSTYRDPQKPTDVKVVVELSKDTEGVLKRVGTNYYWDFASDKPKTARKVRATSYRAPVLASASSAPITQATVSRMGRGRKVYRGRPIDLDFKDADIHNLLRLLADVGGVNIVIPDEIKASVTVRLRRVPWDQAMEVILASKGLWYRRQGDLIRVAPRRELVKEDEDEAARIKALAAQEPPEPEVFPLNYAQANQVRTQLSPLLSPRGRIEVDARSNSLIINDVRAHRRRIIDMVRRLDTQTPQIQIEARIVEARTTFTREFGIQWGGNAIGSAATGNATGLIFPSTVALAGAADDGQANTTGVTAAPTNFAVNMPAAIGAGSGGGLGFSFGSVGGNFNLNLRLSALEDTGTIRTVSQPKITVLNNVEASISSGVSIPISVVSANGVNTQFVPADLKLTVTPSVSQRDCSISMAVSVSNNQADFANTGARGDPSILRREASTQIIVADGETSVIGGIYTRNTGRSYNKVPFLADLPLIGMLFKSRRDVDERSEVLVFITPTITNRAYLPCE